MSRSRLSEFAKEKVFWTRKMNLKLVKFIESRPIIWNPKHPKYTSTELRDKTFAEFASKYDNAFSGQAVKDRWTNIRCTFAYYLRKWSANRLKCDGEDFKVNWNLWDACQFLVKVNRKYIDTSASDDLTNLENNSGPESENEHDLSDKEECVENNKSFDNQCETVAENLLQVFKGVQNDAFGIDNTKHGKIGTMVAKKLSQMNSLYAARASLIDKDNPDKIHVLGNSPNSINFIELLKWKWDKLHEETNVFKYKIDKLEERVNDGKYLVQLNPDRGSKRRTPEQIDDICQPFNPNKFNFNKVVPSEVLFGIIENNDQAEHLLIVNVSPISRYHTLLCPSVAECLPQVITESSIRLALELMFLAQNRDLRIGFNSLCAMASVNHLHYHLFLEPHNLPVETANCKHIKGPLYYLDNYPVEAFCFEIHQSTIKENSCNIFKLIAHFIDNSTAHNVIITRGRKVATVTEKGAKTASKTDEVTRATKSYENNTVAAPESNVTAVSNSTSTAVTARGAKTTSKTGEATRATESDVIKTVNVTENNETAVTSSSKTAPVRSDASNNATKSAGVTDFIEYDKSSGYKHDTDKNHTGYDKVIGSDKECVRVLVWPRRNSAGVKQLSNFNVAVCELSGWFPVFNSDAFNNLTTENLEKELSKWKIDNFMELCEDVKCLF